MDPYFTIWFCFHTEYTSVKCNLTMHTRTLIMYSFYLSLRLFKGNIRYNFVFNNNNNNNNNNNELVCP
jgi:hypothetical protein